MRKHVFDDDDDDDDNDDDDVFFVHIFGVLRFEFAGPYSCLVVSSIGRSVFVLELLICCSLFVGERKYAEKSHVHFVF